jgi:hypothetical protein
MEMEGDWWLLGGWLKTGPRSEGGCGDALSRRKTHLIELIALFTGDGNYKEYNL